MAIVAVAVAAAAAAAAAAVAVAVVFVFVFFTIIKSNKSIIVRLRFRATIFLCEIHNFHFVVSVQFTLCKKYMSRVVTYIPTFTVVWKCRIGDTRFYFYVVKM
jgi:hypothetical protein